MADLGASRLQQKMNSERPSSMTVPAWASKKLQGEAALWSTRQDNGTGASSSSFRSTTEEDVQLRLRKMIAPSLQRVEAFLEEEQQQLEQASTKELLTRSWPTPSAR